MLLYGAPETRIKIGGSFTIIYFPFKKYHNASPPAMTMTIKTIGNADPVLAPPLGNGALLAALPSAAVLVAVGEIVFGAVIPVPGEL